MNTKPEARLRACVFGEVQGVAFRWNARRVGAELGVCGWVANKSDGSVELVAEGERRLLESLLAWCREGPRFARVDRVEASWEPATGEFDHFFIHH
ncbi:MAG: acylphosphatase [Deltaproteobacteria bacterium]|nr:acylphosphatase [Deltaproteobacteria bacterium]